MEASMVLIRQRFLQRVITSTICTKATTEPFLTINDICEYNPLFYGKLKQLFTVSNRMLRKYRDNMIF